MDSSFIFSSLDEKDILIVINAMEEKKFNKGEVVIKQYDEGKNLFVVDSGTLDCVRAFVISL